MGLDRCLGHMELIGDAATVMVTHDRSQLDRVDTIHEMDDGIVASTRVGQLR